MDLPDAVAYNAKRGLPGELPAGAVAAYPGLGSDPQIDSREVFALAVGALQSEGNLSSDGKLGPKTWSYIEEAYGADPEDEIRHAQRKARMAEIDLEEVLRGDKAGKEPPWVGSSRHVLDAARHEWELVVAEPDGPNWKHIRKYIYEGLRWPESRWPYDKNGDFAWCGAFAAWCYREAGLKDDLLYKRFASTRRLYDWAHGTDRFIVTPSGLAPCDIVVVGRGDSKAWGAHITLVRELADDVVLTFEGNAKGTLGDGTTGEGVVRHQRPTSGAGLPDKTYRFLYGVHPLEEDYA